MLEYLIVISDDVLYAFRFPPEGGRWDLAFVSLGNRNMKSSKVILGAAFAALAGLSAPAHANVVSYTVTGAQFANFGQGTQTLAGTFTVDYGANAVTALSLTATGFETLNFQLSGNNGFTYTGTHGVEDQYEIGIQSNQGTQLYLDYQANPTVTLILNSDNGYQSNLYNTSHQYSNLTSPGTTSSAPEPATWALMLVGFGGLGFAMRSARRQRAAVAA